MQGERLPSPRPKTLPPLPLNVLSEVEELEALATQMLKDCGRGYGFNLEKAVRILRSCAPESFNLQARYYVSRNDYHSRWLKELHGRCVLAIAGLVGRDRYFSNAQEDLLRLEVSLVLDDCLENWKSQKPTGTKVVGVQSVQPVAKKRLPATITSQLAAARLDAYLRKNNIGQAEFATRAQTTERTLRSFRKNGKLRRDLFDNVAKQMGLTRDELLKSGPIG